MSLQPNFEKPKRTNDGLSFLTRTQLRMMFAFILIALGFVFILGQRGALDFGSNWWVIFIAIPGGFLMWAALQGYEHAGKVTTRVAFEGLLGTFALLLSLIFVADPSWSFVRSWRLDEAFPFLRGINWNILWQWALVVVGAVILFKSYRNRSVRPGIFGVILVVVGLVFIFDISWNLIWPLAIIACGVGLLFPRGNNNSAD